MWRFVKLWVIIAHNEVDYYELITLDNLTARIEVIRLLKNISTFDIM